MTAYVAEAAQPYRPGVVVTGAGQLTVNHGEFTLSAALVQDDTIKMCKLPAQHVPVDLVGSCSDLDTGGSPAIVMQIGLNDTPGDTDDVDAFSASVTAGQAGGVFRMDAIAAHRIAPVDYDREVMITVGTGPATGATTGTISVDLVSRPAGADD